MKKLALLIAALAFIGAEAYSQRILLSQGFENGPYTVDSLPLKWAKQFEIAPTCFSPAADWRVRDSGKVFCGTNSLPGFTSKSYLSRKGLSIPWTAGNPTFCNYWVFTDSLRIATGDSLIFWIQLGTWPDGQSTYYKDSLQVWVTSAQTFASQIARLGTVVSLPQATNVWQLKIFDLSAYNGQRIYVAFRYFMNVSVDGIMVNVDSVQVRNLSGPPVAVHHNNETPYKFDLKQNYPNPFNPSTVISFDLAKDEFVNLTVYNSIGQEVAVLVNEKREAGPHSVSFDATNLPSGVYLYRLKAGDYTKSMKMSLIK
ncbi:MAG TPA: choice-of-anchor J domain-containing protein [Ignavibacteria bacterium]|jgi:hypothetical protein